MSATSYSEPFVHGRLVTAPPARSHSVPSQLLFREVNEQIRRRRSATDDIGADIEIVCECHSTGCAKELRLPLERYESVRRFPTRFVMKSGHTAEDERVVEDHGSFVIVEKTGRSAGVAIRLDPRKRRRRDASTTTS